MTVKDAAKKLGLTRYAIYKRIKAGTIKAKQRKDGVYVIDGRTVK